MPLASNIYKIIRLKGYLYIQESYPFNKLKDLVTYLYALGPLTFLYPNQNLHQLYNNTMY